jgi:adenylate cyclase
MLHFYITYKKSSRSQLEHANGPIEFGRGPARGVTRRVLEDPFISRDQLRVEELPPGRLRCENLSQRFPVRLASGDLIAPGASMECTLPVRFTIGETMIEADAVSARRADEDALQTVGRPFRPGSSVAQTLLPSADEAVDATRLTRWFETLVSVQRASASSGEFYRQTAHALVDLIGLDSGLVLLRRGDDWEVAARHAADPNQELGFSASVLDRVCREKRTFFRGAADGAASASLLGLDAVVAAPVLGDDDRVLGVVYGARLQRPGLTAVLVRPLEAQLVQILAATVGAGLARLESEADAARRCVQFEQFFSPELARELDRDPSLLQGRDRELTVLFSDIRGFSKVSERVGPRETCELACDVMDRITEQVRARSGVVVNYSGDGMLAMWNAPTDLRGHAVLACHAALAMRAELPGLDVRWKDRIGRKLALGIGLNTGSALVGNIGSRSKFMYGPQGHSVNLASRVEGATKHLGVPILITGATYAQLGGAFATRRLCRVRVVGIDGAVDLYQLHAAEADDQWLGRRDAYEKGLALFEAGKWREACRVLYPLMSEVEGEDDPPTLLLVERCIECLRTPGRPFDPVLDLDHK